MVPPVNLLGVRVKKVAGADIPEVLGKRPFEKLGRPLSIFFLGGPPGVAERACSMLNRQDSKSVVCTGALDPGSGSIEEMSADSVLDAIDGSHADFLVVALGAAKGQAWLMRNRNRLQVPITSHLGATVNYVAGAIPRAPSFWQRAGVEWLWRIGQEPQLKARYGRDFCVVMRLLWSRVLPLALWLRWNGLKHRTDSAKVTLTRDGLSIAGAATAANLGEIRLGLGEASARAGSLTVDLTGLEHFDLSFLGLLLIARVAMRHRGRELRIAGLPRRFERVLVWAGYP
jgi:N-acetylglucosaminyldiphosphoundecaprenol N-acetyl-beta-D-mannosaminyltransferase